MRTRILVSGMIVGAAWSGAALGDVIVSLSNPGNPILHEIEVTPGETFSIDLSLEADRKLFSVRTAIGADVSGVFDLVQTIDNPPWSSAAYPPALGSLDPCTNPFTTSVPFPDSFGPGTTGLATFLLSVKSATSAGTYTIQVVAPEFLWSRINPIAPDPAMLGTALVVHVVPEPTGLLLMLVLACRLGLKQRLDEMREMR